MYGGDWRGIGSVCRHDQGLFRDWNLSLVNGLTKWVSAALLCVSLGVEKMTWSTDWEWQSHWLGPRHGLDGHHLHTRLEFNLEDRTWLLNLNSVQAQKCAVYITSLSTFSGLCADLGLQVMQDTELGEAQQQAADLAVTAGDLTFGDESGLVQQLQSWMSFNYVFFSGSSWICSISLKLIDERGFVVRFVLRSDDSRNSTFFILYIT